MIAKEEDEQTRDAIDDSNDEFCTTIEQSSAADGEAAKV